MKPQIALLASLFASAAAVCQKTGEDLPKPTGTGTPVNEPCYVHDATCGPYVVRGEASPRIGGLDSNASPSR